MISTGDLRRGAMFDLDGQIVSVLDFQHQKIGRGSAQVRMRLRNVRTGAIFDRTVQAGEKWARVRLEHHTVQFLYREGDKLVFMNSETYEQIELDEDFVGERVAFLQDGMTVTLRLHGDRPISVRLPDQVVLTVTVPQYC